MSHPFTDAQLAAYLERTLDDDALRDAIHTAIRTDPALARRIEALTGGEEIASAVRNAFAPVLDAPVPQRMTATLTGGERSEVVDLAAVRIRDRLPRPANDTGRFGGNWRWPQFGAMAASLALGVLIGGPLISGKGDARQGDESLVLASADLETMLDSAPSGQKVDLAALGRGEVVLTFRNDEGELCRQFMLEGTGGKTSDALACTGIDADRGWQIEAYGRRAAPLGEMRLAGGDAAPAVVAAVDALIVGQPLVGADEAASLKSR
jgi:hypothetical protein